MNIQTFSKNEPISKAIEILDRDGAVVLHDAFGRSFANNVERELRPYFSDTPYGEGYFWGKKTKRMGGLFVKSEHCRELAIDDTVLGIVEGIMLNFCSNIQINLTQGIGIDPGEPAQILHRDDEVFPFPHDGMQLEINTMLALDDFTEANGATRIALGTHRGEIDRDVPEEKLAKAVMPKGSLLIYLASVVHGGGANQTDICRRGAVISYGAGWLRQAENQYLVNPPEIARTYPDRLQRLIGYDVHVPNLGWVEGQHPRVVLDGTYTSTMAAQDFLPTEAEELLKQRYHSLAA